MKIKKISFFLFFLFFCFYVILSNSFHAKTQYLIVPCLGQNDTMLLAMSSAGLNRLELMTHVLAQHPTIKAVACIVTLDGLQRTLANHLGLLRSNNGGLPLHVLRVQVLQIGFSRVDSLSAAKRTKVPDVLWILSGRRCMHEWPDDVLLEQVLVGSHFFEVYKINELVTIVFVYLENKLIFLITQNINQFFVIFLKIPFLSKFLIQKLKIKIIIIIILKLFQNYIAN